MPHFLSMHSKTSSPPLFLTCACFLMFGMLEQGTTSASVYLLTSFLGVPLQLTMDKGSEVGEMANCQEILRYILRFFSHLDECSHPMCCTACMLLPISPSMLGQQIVQSQTLAKVGHPTCTFTCKGGTSWCRPKECKTRSGWSTENFIEACKTSTGRWMLPL